MAREVDGQSSYIDRVVGEGLFVFGPEGTVELRDPRKPEFPNYGFDTVIDGVKAAIAATSVPELEIRNHDLALVAHLAKYFDRRIAVALVGKMRMRKEEYDERGEAAKTPFALRNIVDPFERSMVLMNTGSFSTTHGCTGGCKWCAYDAFATGDIVTTPLEQKKHFFDELIAQLDANDLTEEQREQAVRSVFLFMDTDPFDDPDLEELLAHIYERAGIVPFISTVLPAKGLATFKRLSGYARKYKDLRLLNSFESELQEFIGEYDGVVFNSFSDVLNMEEKIESLDYLATLHGVLEHTKNLPGSIRATILASQMQDRYETGLAEHIPSIRIEDLIVDDIEDDYVRIGEEIERKREAYSALGDLKDFKEKVQRFFARYELVFKRYSDDLGQLYDFDFDINKVLGTIRKLESELKGKPDVGVIRVSATKHRRKALSEVASDSSLYFTVEDRNVSGDPIRDRLYLAGKEFFDSGDEVGEGSISCKNSLCISPFGIFNTVTGRPTHSYPQGRMLVPYQGLIAGRGLAKPGEELTDVLKHSIVIHREHFSKPPDRIFVIDGDRRLREIQFDLESYRVISDQVVKEGVTSIKDVEYLKEDVWSKLA